MQQVVKPTVHLANFASRRTLACHGPGLVWSIMRYTPQWAVRFGELEVLAPAGGDLQAMRAGEMEVAEYRDRFLAGVAQKVMVEDKPGGIVGWSLAPGRLGVYAIGGLHAVKDGDTLCCTCSREQASAGRCHRVWTAELLHANGWQVVLDGVDFPAVSSEIRPACIGPLFDGR